MRRRVSAGTKPTASAGSRHKLPARQFAMTSAKNEWFSLYKTSRWVHPRYGVRIQCLKRDLYRCTMCLRTEASSRLVAHHVTPHKGDVKLFFSLENLRTLCQPCHDTVATVRERIGYSRELDRDGYPVDKNHPFCR